MMVGSPWCSRHCRYPPQELAQPKGLAILPILNYRAFLANFGRQPGAQSVQEIQIQNKPIFARPAGNFVVVGLDGQTVDQYQAPTTRHCRENEKPWQARD